MADGFRLGSAYLEVNPDTDGFKDKVKADLDKDKTDIKVKVSPDTAGFQAKLDEVIDKDKLKRISIAVDYNKSQLDSAMKDAGSDASKAFQDAFSNGGGGGGGAGGGFGGAALGTGIGAAVVAALAVLPATVAGIGALAGAAGGAALVLEFDKSNKQVAAGLTQLETTFTSTIKSVIQPMVAPTVDALKQISGWIVSLKPQLTDLFQTSSKYLMPFVEGLEQTVSNILPGFNAMIKAAGPTVQTFANAFSMLGTYFSNFFKDLIPGLAGSDAAFTGIISLLGELLDAIGKVASGLAQGSGKTLGTFFSTLGKFIEGVLLAVLPLLNAAFNSLLPPIEKLAMSLIPLVSALANGLAPILKALSPLFTDIVKLVEPLVPILVQVTDIVVKVAVTAFTPLLKVIESLTPSIMKIVTIIGDSFLTVLTQLEPVITQFGGLIGQLAKALLPPLLDMFVKILPPILKVQETMITGMMPAITQLIPPLVKLINNLQPLIDMLTKLIPIVIEFAARIEIDVIKNAIIPFVTWTAKIVAGIVDVIAYFVKWAGTINDWKNLWKEVWTDVQNWWNNIERTIVQFLDTIKTNVTNWINDIRKALSGAWDTIYQDISRSWSTIANFFSEWWGREIQGWKNIGNDVRNFFASTWTSVYSDVKRIWGDIESFFDGFWKHIESGATNAIGAFTNAWGGIEKTFKGPVNYLIGTVYDNGIRKFWNDIVGAVGLKSLDLPNVPQLSRGGVMPGYEPGIDRHLIAVSGGEGILVPEAVKGLGGAATINAINAAYAGYRGAGKSGAGSHFAAGGTAPVGGRAGALGAQNSSGPALGPLQGAATAIADVSKITAAILTGNTTALTNALTGSLGVGGGAVGDLAKVMLAIPTTLVKSLVTQLGTQASTLGTGPGSGPLGGATSASEMASGAAIFKYLMANAHMTDTAAAGAIASIWGESTWNPLAAGTGGRGLIGWTPPGTLSNSAFIPGNPVESLNRQLPAIIKFIGSSGDWGVISEMNKATTVLQAANLWGKGVERYGINDVHPEGLALATQIMNGYAKTPGAASTKAAQTAASHGSQGGFANGGVAPGWARVGERGPELIHMSGGETILDAITSQYVTGGVRGYASGSLPPTQQQKALQQAATYAADAATARRNADAKGLTRAKREAYLQSADTYAADAARYEQLADEYANQARAKAAAAKAKALATEQKTGNSLISNLVTQFNGSTTLGTYTSATGAVTSLIGGAVPSTSSLNSDLSNALKAITSYYSGAKAKSLETSLQKQTDSMQNLLAKYSSVTATISAASSYATSTTSSLSSYAGLSGLGLVPSSPGVSGAGFGPVIATALRQKLASLQTFNTAIKTAVSKKLNTSFIQQAIALGPDGGTQYLQAATSGGSSVINTINSVMGQLTTEETTIGQTAGNAIYDPSAIGKSFLAGLQSQAAGLDKEMQSLGTTFAKTVAKDLKIPVSSVPHFAQGGFAAAGTYAMVGEQGPEMVRFGTGGQVYTAQQTKQMMSGAQGQDISINFYGTQYPNAEQIANLKLEFANQLGAFNV